MSTKSENGVNINFNTMGFFSVLTLILITLKLTHYIDWAWYWIILPFFIPFIILIITALTMGIIVGGRILIAAYLDKRRYK